jgi:predicted amidohydrolase
MVTFSIIQSNLHWENKTANLNMFAEKISTIHPTTDIIVLPEMFSTGFSMNPTLLAETMDGASITWMRQQAAQYQKIICGSVMIKEGNQYYNRLVWMQPDGEHKVYDKRHLFAYANEQEHYTSGSNKIIVQANGLKILPLICYDLRFPVWARQATDTYDVLLYVANWPERRSHAWKTLLTARAIENQCYVVALNRVGYDGNNIYHSGDSMVVNPMGEVLFHHAQDELIHTFTIDKNEIKTIRSKFPFLQDRDHFEISY